MPKPFESKRLILRPLVSEDYSIMRALHSDPEVMKYIASGAPRTEEQTRAGLQKGLQIAVDNPLLGAWVAVEKLSGITVGNLILREPATDEKTDGLEVGFSFLREHWGKGYATEANQAMIEYVRQYLKETRIIALIDSQNQASRNVLQKTGFKSVGFSVYVDPTTGNKVPTEILELNLRFSVEK